MTIAQRVAGFLREHKPKRFCDDCICERLSLSRRQQAFRVTSALGETSDFVRDDGECSQCHKSPRKVTAASK